MTYLGWWTLEGSEMAVFVVAYARCPGVCVCVCVCVWACVCACACACVQIYASGTIAHSPPSHCRHLLHFHSPTLSPTSLPVHSLPLATHTPS